MKKIKIGGMDFEVIEEPKQFVDKDNAVDGLISYDKAQIRVWSGCSLDYMNEVLCHEIIHGIIQQYNVPVQKELNEIMTEALGKGLHQVLKDNKDILFKNILDHVDELDKPQNLTCEPRKHKSR